MRPAIADLIRNTIYPDLQDDATVLNYPDVAGRQPAASYGGFRGQLASCWCMPVHST